MIGATTDRELHEECGVFGVFGVPGAAELTYYGLHALQHRGQEGCGIVSVNDAGALRRIKGEGLVTEVFNEANLRTLEGSMAVGHVRYSTSGGGGIENVQPFLFRHFTGDFALAHNGNLVNSHLLRRWLEDKGSLFQSSSDSEVLAHLIKKETRNHTQPRIYAIVEALNMIEGAFAFLIMTANRIYAARDKYGLRPLSIGRLGDGFVVSSETCALDAVGAEFLRDVEPGEIATLDGKGIRSTDYSMYKRHAICAMEYIYFARPDSDIERCNVHAFRKRSGRLLWQESPADADVVVGVPDSSLSAAMGFAEASGIPYEMGLIKNRYIGRTFIQPSQAMREKGVRMKLSAVGSLVRGRRVALVDDSIVRGTTSQRIVRLLREAGATEVHVRIASPPITHPCFYGVDTSTYDELLC
ncbi:MAG: amidophosphoribosyltransferase, partial [Alistipes sp.]